MINFLLKRVATGIVLIYVVLTLIFLMLHAVPGDPAMQLLAGDGAAQVTPAALEAARERLGLNAPLPVQYWNYLAGAVQLDLGTSFQDGAPVLDLVSERLPNTLELVLLAVLIALAVGIPLGSVAARRGGFVDSAISVGTSIGMSVPVYVVGALFVLLFALKLGWFPAGGYEEAGGNFVGHVSRVVLPAAALSFGIASIIARMTRSAILDNYRQDWVRTARSWGIGRRLVFRKHVLRNSLTPVATVTALQIGTLLGSTVLVERIFNWPGISALLVDSVIERDYPVVQGIVIILSAIFIFINILVDVLYGYLDPRARVS
ncbi:ABC transporter permease [Crystallibacter degradans]|uniref:ABC transporter permease n=1 Tax=Crystallibacter degradans TaxID=2726743 RepID=UPI001475A697|nr:ABC transporter permease [Arthrobacter sp. SF27]NMR32246.1 ABC transporter permease [Arthrobacter sp. SF27]